MRLLVGVNGVFDAEIILYIDAFQTVDNAEMTVTRNTLIAVAEIFFDNGALATGFDNE